MRPPVHMPPPHATHAVITDYPSIASRAPATLAPLIDRFRLSGVTAVRYVCTGDWRIDPPRRVADDMFFYILGGRATMDVAGRAARLRAGDLVHWRRGVTHAAGTAADDPIPVISIHYTASIDGALHLPAALGFPDLFHLGAGHPLEALADDACREYLHRAPGWERSLEAIVARFIIELVRGRGGDLRPDPDGARTPDVERVVPAIEAMAASIAAPLAIPALARRCRLSEAQFRRVFARATGRTPVEHQRALRLEEACRLLRTTRDAVPSISTAVGYADPSFFTRTFRAAYGVTPGKYRDQTAV
ncbi:MAG TPA: helix-turn-helix domain-containing protein [Planctomycetota bacterium]|nr:helix-turn-helix domain-containing protein [Planctomycetota bacterium]